MKTKKRLHIVDEIAGRAKEDLENMVKNPIFRNSLSQMEQAYLLANQGLFKLSELHQLKNNLFDQLKDAQRVLDDVNKRKAEKLVPIQREIPRPSYEYVEYDQVLRELGPIKEFMEEVDGKAHLDIPQIDASESKTLQEAIKDAQLLLSENGSPNAVDRFHTVLQTFLERKCKKSNITYPENSSINVLLKLLKEKCPKLIKLQKQDPHVVEILKGMSNTLSKLSELRNQKSLAHPNELMSIDEANFVIESVNAILRYLSAKLD